ncbi:MAG: hypothetical protein P857_391 [Candidatus Xenolissoclinum pacificiensis L6]|uniref:Flagellar FliJ protein n=1 Tax=Candidatus Xenolissoclinum pacificiensis L6 TaxID=1401685 RepID=W2UZ98_9RICK|nr:MAG: hypothetical protein P857_391 [Candidatus Xenolissoclinum pacificiensis L6]
MKEINLLIKLKKSEMHKYENEISGIISKIDKLNILLDKSYRVLNDYQVSIYNKETSYQMQSYYIQSQRIVYEDIMVMRNQIHRLENQKSSLYYQVQHCLKYIDYLKEKKQRYFDIQEQEREKKYSRLMHDLIVCKKSHKGSS